jgi:phosphate-selective porin OprO/OprP
MSWYLNPYAKLMFNWVHFTGQRTSLVDAATVLGTVKGDAFGTRLHLDW